jgi:hypothetical protein
MQLPVRPNARMLKWMLDVGWRASLEWASLASRVEAQAFLSSAQP